MTRKCSRLLDDWVRVGIAIAMHGFLLQVHSALLLTAYERVDFMDETSEVENFGAHKKSDESCFVWNFLSSSASLKACSDTLF